MRRFWPCASAAALLLSGCLSLSTPVGAAGAVSASPAASPSPAVSASPAAAPASTLYEAPRVTAEQAKARMAQEPVVVVDVRGAAAYQLEHVAGAINIPWADLEKGYQQLPKDRLILLYCT
jgi:3-mercaptopyruvate sulfurtransferase SseA